MAGLQGTVSPTALLSAMTLYFNMDGCSAGHYDQLAVQYYTIGDVCPYQQWSVADNGH